MNHTLDLSDEATPGDRTTPILDSPDSQSHNADTGRRRSCSDNIVLGCLLLALSASFYYGWFHDGTHPLGGIGWADQRQYTYAARRLADFQLPTTAQLHFAPSYSILGAVTAQIWYGDPFWLVSYLLLMGSAAFLYRGARAMLNPFFVVLFFLALFAWDGHARTFDYASELFAIPWNNQLLFFAFAFLFWLFATRTTGPIDDRLMLAMGAIGGVLATAREESVIFIVPLALLYLTVRRARLRSWAAAGGAAIAAAAPGLAIKYFVLGSIFAVSPNRPGDSYSGAASGYFSLHHLAVNLRDVVVDANLAPVDPRRHALLQSQPWLWIAPIGLLILVLGRRTNILVRGFVAMSGLLTAFYLSGDNMSAAKMKFHCLRYISPAFIAMNLGTAVVLERTWKFANARARSRTANDRGPARVRTRMLPADSSGGGA